MSVILGVIGERLSGKNTLAEYLVKKYDAFAISHSQILDEILTILDLPISRRNEIDLGMALRGPFGVEVLARALRKRVLETDKDLIVIQSIRFSHEVTNVKELGGRIIFIEVPLETAFQRMQRRREKTDDDMSFEQFKQMRTEPTEIGIADLKQQAEFIISNDSTVEQFYEKIDKIMKQLNK